MTAAEAIRFASTLEPKSYTGRCEIELAALRAAFDLLNMGSRERALSKLLADAEHFRRADVPGHLTWYEYHLRAAAWAAENFGVTP